jgi:hypothetical protein
VTAVSARGAWAVGDTNSLRSLILHWNGTGWKRVASPATHGNAVLLTGVAATSASNAWAAGIAGTTRGGPFILHWNGASWRRAPSPVRHGALLAVAASGRSAWAVGFVGNAGFPGSRATNRPLILHWNGAAWRRVPTICPRAWATCVA